MTPDAQATAFAPKVWAPLACLLAIFGSVCYWNLGAFDMLVWDEAEYAAIGRSLTRGEGYAISGVQQWIRPPVTPAIIGASILLFGEGSDVAAKALTPIVTMALLALVYGIVLAAHGRFAALAAAGALAIGPEFLAHSLMLLSEAPFLLFHTAALAGFYLAFRREPRWFYAAWVALALAFLTRYTALLFGPTLLLLLLYEALTNRSRLMRTVRSRAFWLAPACGAVLLAPWFYWEWLVKGDVLAGVRYASGQIPAYDLAEMPWHFYLSSMPGAMTLPIAAAGAAGLAYALWRNLPLGVYAAIAAGVVLAWHTQYDYKEMRLVDSVLPLFAIGAGIAAQAWAEQFPAPRRLLRYGVPAAVFTLAALLAAVVSSRNFRTHLTLGEPSFLHAMAYVRANFPPDTSLLGTNQAQIHWYADRPTHRTFKNLQAPRDLADQAAAVDWVVITNFERGQPPALTELLNQVTTADQLGGDVQVFQDRFFATVLAKSNWVQERLSE